jgi:hypothetical protein
MALICETCGQATEDRTDRFCPRHAIKELQAQDEAGYLEPLEYRTVDGRVRLSKFPFLVLEEAAAKYLPWLEGEWEEPLTLACKAF